MASARAGPNHFHHRPTDTAEVLGDDHIMTHGATETETDELRGERCGGLRKKRATRDPARAIHHGGRTSKREEGGRPYNAADSFDRGSQEEDDDGGVASIPQNLLNRIRAPSHPSSAGRQSIKKARFGRKLSSGRATAAGSAPAGVVVAVVVVGGGGDGAEPVVDEGGGAERSGFPRPV